MLKVEKITTMNLENAIRGARNPMNSWGKSDSDYDETGQYILGNNDLALAQKLCNAGSDHRKFIRQIFVSMDITAPLYWWKEFDTYKVSTVSNSTSTMHKLHSNPFSIDDFSHDLMSTEAITHLTNLISFLENTRQKYNNSKDRSHWDDLIQLLPSSYNQLRTCTMNYETLRNIYNARRNHKLTEWHTFCNYVASLPYFEQMIKTT